MHHIKILLFTVDKCMSLKDVAGSALLYLADHKK